MPAQNNLRTQVTRKMFDAAKQQQDKPKDAVALLKADHQEAKELYKKFFKAKTAAQKKELAGQLCLALSVHMRIEEDIFYPAVAKALKEKDKLVVPEARVEHSSLKRLITEVEEAPEDDEFEARVQVMCEYTTHHVKEEETKMFPKAKASGVDLADLGERLQYRKLELLNQVASKASGQKQPPKPSSLFKQRASRSKTRGNGTRQPSARS
ncbi:MAG TPA: hemerythrin domain-containing protein [Gammaproteobacteria bacterium]|jgi:hemerythrin superfamily protein